MPKPLTSCITSTIASLRDRIRRWTRPSTRPILGYLLDRLRSPEDLVRENALLRKQLEVACRQITRPRVSGNPILPRYGKRKFPTLLTKEVWDGDD